VPIPIPDLDVPDIAAVLPELQRLADQFRDGAHIITHCRFGIGRSSLLAAAILVLDGATPDDVWHQIELARGHTVPDTATQRHWPTKLPKQT
jgi:protein-tyrosine phosphatase